MPAVKMLLSSIRINGGTQARVSIDEETVADYALAMQLGAEFPPVVVFEDGADFWLADGFTRYHAHKKVGSDSILADIHPGTRRDAILYSVGANVEHGLRRSNADKRKAVTTLLQDEEWGKWSDREIAKQAGVSHVFVGEVRRSMETPSTENRSFTNKHGTASTRSTKTSEKAEAQKAARDAKAAAKQAEREAKAAAKKKAREEKAAAKKAERDAKAAAKKTARQEKAAAKKKAKEEADQRAKDAAMTADEQATEFEKVLAENRQLIAQVKALETDDTKAALAKEIELRRLAEDEKGRLMNQLATQNKALRKFGKYFDDLRKITGATTNAGVVEAVRVAFQQAA